MMESSQESAALSPPPPTLTPSYLSKVVAAHKKAYSYLWYGNSIVQEGEGNYGVYQIASFTDLVPADEEEEAGYKLLSDRAREET